MKILNFGSCNIDYVYSLDHIVLSGETETTYRLETFPGGKGLNQSIAAAKSGVKVYHAGYVGYDGKMLTDILSENNVDISYISKIQEKTGHAVIQVGRNGENSIFLYSGTNGMITKDYIDFVLKKFGRNDILLLQNEISNVDYIVEQAYCKNMCIVLNPSPFNEKINKIDFNKLSYIILNEIEAKAISSCDTAEESLAYIKNKYPKLKVMLTLGSNGCIYTDSSCEFYQRAFKVKTVDTTAAGDTFTGYFVAELLKGTDYQKILKIASAAAALAVSKKGAAPSVPDKNEVISALESFEESKANSKSDIIRKQIDDYITKNIKTANLNELSAILCYTSTYTGILVKKLTGKSFTKTVQEKRCAIAAEKLLNTDLPVSSIIKDLGYENESFFRKVFKEKYGKIPLEYRKRGIK